jgi:hypothetical protein
MGFLVTTSLSTSRACPTSLAPAASLTMASSSAVVAYGPPTTSPAPTCRQGQAGTLAQQRSGCGLALDVERLGTCRQCNLGVRHCELCGFFSVSGEGLQRNALVILSHRGYNIQGLGDPGGDDA